MAGLAFLKGTIFRHLAENAAARQADKYLKNYHNQHSRCGFKVLKHIILQGRENGV